MRPLGAEHFSGKTVVELRDVEINNPNQKMEVTPCWSIQQMLQPNIQITDL